MTRPPKTNKDGTPDKRANNGGYHLTKAERAERATKCLTMRNAGATYNHIAQRLNISEQLARNDVTWALKEFVKIPAAQMVEQQRAVLLDIKRIEYPALLDPANPRHYQAVDKILEALAHEAKLFGLFAPAKVTLGISEQEFAAQAAELLKITGVGPLLELAGSPGVVDAEVIESAGLDGWADG